MFSTSGESEGGGRAGASGEGVSPLLHCPRYVRVPTLPNTTLSSLCGTPASQSYPGRGDYLLAEQRERCIRVIAIQVGKECSQRVHVLIFPLYVSVMLYFQLKPRFQSLSRSHSSPSHFSVAGARATWSHHIHLDSGPLGAITFFCSRSRSHSEPSHLLGAKAGAVL